MDKETKPKKPVGRPRTTVNDLPPDWKQIKDKMSRKKTSGIYALCCPDSGEVRYVGQSIDINERYKQHIKSESTSPNSKWVDSLILSGKKPDLKILEIEENKDRRDILEKKWIAYYKNHSEILNLHMGGRWDNIDDPKPWRVAGVSYPSKLYSLRCRNIGVDASMVTEAASNCKNQHERMKFEALVAQALWNTSLQSKLKEWAVKVAPRIEKHFPELING